MFFTDGLNVKPKSVNPNLQFQEKELIIKEFKSPLEEPIRIDRASYMPPHKELYRPGGL